MSMIWVDIETTGLDENSGYVLELGLIETDDQLVEQRRTSFLVLPDEYLSLVQERCASHVREMHQQNGLWAAVEAEGMALPDAEAAAMAWMGSVSSPMCGSSIHFDRRWLTRHMPDLVSLFHYRNIDVSTVKELNKRFGPDAAIYVAPCEKEHRALSDLEDSINELRFYLGRMGWL